MAEMTLKQLAEHTGAHIIGDEDVIVHSVSAIDSAGDGQITFLNSKRYLPLVKTTKASAIIVDEEIDCRVPLLVAKDAYYAFQQIVVILHGHRRHKRVGISKHADISDTATLGANCDVHSFATISDNAKIGNNCRIYPGVFIGPDVEIGDDCIFYPNAVIYDATIIGNHVIVHANASIGEDGYGFATHNGTYHKIPQIGRVVLEDDVEIGSGCAIERGTLDDTVIGRGCKIGDMVTIGHGTKVGPYCLLVPQAGVAGSVRVGHHCMMGGQVGIVGHVRIGNMVKIAAQAGVINDIPDGATVIGAPAIDAQKARRAYSLIEYLPEMRKRIRRLERRLDESEKGPR